MYKNITMEKALEDTDSLLVDVRSEDEYNEDTVPFAVNIPLLNNEERNMVGIVYKKEGQDEARRLGLQLVAPKLPQMVDSYARQAANKKITVFCWRGGARSEAIASLLDGLGFKVNRVLGGYKAYRRMVFNFFDRPLLPFKAVILHGLTGVGKTDVITGLKAQGIPALDLEGLAEHRGSVYGKIGLPSSPSQKKFESRIYEFFRCSRSGVFVVECESRRLGKLLLPESLMSTMQQGYNLLLYASLRERVERIEKVYAKDMELNLENLYEATNHLTKHLGKGKITELNELLQDKKIKEFIGYLLTEYYDPLYKYPQGPSDKYLLSINSDNINDAVIAVRSFMANLPENQSLDQEVG
ncbi:tRNA 2-selenouridine synthase [Desulfofarcimen acetoxidans DSM 771]|uniref:tRNA 2-selenouridine synthase n=1 Tax=Desulfofarcimen acetoxidans (strain ATCC 49208 / DSM 771 / KCTC 5769 / VKM B-1644 / 5575) TaxID=485916 RepID=C8W4H9_DESAS|nr:tRNA 2-selenouridine(34) synthase MnmH [Desulfofarcimen acetoxidans]ACV63865.1 tRNA 2-selenouridine synthase [Desulfofarcimen acetoxidans DSM 771]